MAADAAATPSRRCSRRCETPPTLADRASVAEEFHTVIHADRGVPVCADRASLGFRVRTPASGSPLGACGRVVGDACASVGAGWPRAINGGVRGDNRPHTVGADDPGRIRDTRGRGPVGAGGQAPLPATPGKPWGVASNVVIADARRTRGRQRTKRHSSGWRLRLIDSIWPRCCSGPPMAFSMLLRTPLGWPVGTAGSEDVPAGRGDPRTGAGRRHAPRLWRPPRDRLRRLSRRSIRHMHQAESHRVWIEIARPTIAWRAESPHRTV